MDNREQKNSQKQKKTQKHKNNYTLSTITMVVSRFGVRIIVYSLLAILFYYGSRRRTTLAIRHLL